MRFGYFTIKSFMTCCIITVKNCPQNLHLHWKKPLITFNHNILHVEFQSIIQKSKTNSHRVPQTVISNGRKRKMICPIHNTTRWTQWCIIRHLHQCPIIRHPLIHQRNEGSRGNVCGRIRFQSRDIVRDHRGTCTHERTVVACKQHV